MEQRDFKGVWIPRCVWLDGRLSALDKVILIEIDSLDNGERGCYASNAYLAEFCQCSERKVSATISKLIEFGYISVAGFDGRQRTLRSNLTPQRGSMEETSIEPSKKCEADTKKVLPNNKENNKDTNKDKKERKSARSFDAIIEAYTADETTRELLGMWLQNRKAKRAAMTDNAIRLNLKKLEQFAQQSGMTVNDYLAEVVRRGWQAFYPINGYQQQRRSQPAPTQQQAHPLTDEEQRIKEENAKAFDAWAAMGLTE